MDAELWLLLLVAYLAGLLTVPILRLAKAIEQRDKEKDRWF